MRDVSQSGVGVGEKNRVHVNCNTSHQAPDGLDEHCTHRP